ncbi:MAG: LysR substrate-binding domain-containing protein [Pseudomonadota bacterium]
MHVTLRQLSIFASAAKHASLTRAAEELHLTQPAISMQVKQLEDSVGMPLFTRNGKHIKLTEAGEEMNRYALAITRKVREIGQVMDDLKGLRRGTLRVGTTTTVGMFATRAVAAFYNRYPGVAVNLEVTNRRALLELLENREIDIVLMGYPPDDRNLDATSFLDNPLAVVAPYEHPLRDRKAVNLRELADEPFLLREPGSGTRTTIEGLMEAKNVSLKSALTMTSNEAIKQAVEAGLGIAIVSEHTIGLELEAKRLCKLPVRGFPVLRSWSVVHPADTRLSAAASAFKAMVLENPELLNTQSRPITRLAGNGAEATLADSDGESIDVPPATAPAAAGARPR